MADTYTIMRVWEDGEPMRSQPVTDAAGTPIEFDDADKAIRYTRAHGGWVQRSSDGANFVGCCAQWICPETGEIK